MRTKKVSVELFTVPQEACDSSKMNWVQAGDMIYSQLSKKFGEAISFTQIEFMSGEWFDNEQAQDLLDKGLVTFPFVLVEGEVSSTGSKINISKVNRSIESRI